MIVYSFKYSDIEGLTRLDPEYYDPKFVSKVQLVRNINSKRLSELFEITLGPAYSSKAINDIGDIPIAKIGDVTNKRDYADWDFLSTSEYLKFGSKSIARNEILITLTGDPPDVGKVHMPFSDFHNSETPLAFNQRVGKLATKDICPFFLFAALSTEYFRVRFEQCALGIRQRNVSIPDLRSAFVFIPNDIDINRISQLVKDHFRLKTQSKDLYTHASQLLEDVLGLNNIEFKKEKSYTARASGIVLGKRADAEFFNPKLRHYWNHLEANSGVELVPITQFCTVTKFGNPDYASVGTPIITQKHLADISPEGFGADPIASNSWVTKYSKAILRENDLLFYSVGAYLGKTNIWFNSETAVPASFITLLRPFSETDAGYLMVLLNSKYGILQSKVFQSGTSQQYIYPKDIRQFKVPAIAPSLRQELYDLLKRSYQSKNESQSLLEKAKQEVETLIEQAAQTS